MELKSEQYRVVFFSLVFRKKLKCRQLCQQFVIGLELKSKYGAQTVFKIHPSSMTQLHAILDFLNLLKSWEIFSLMLSLSVISLMNK